jgi:hypothetical protein
LNQWIHGSSFFSFPRCVDSVGCGSAKGEEPEREMSPPPDSDPFSDAEFEKIWGVCQNNSPQSQIADSSPRNAVSFSSARATNRDEIFQCTEQKSTKPPFLPIGVRITAVLD